MAEADSDSSGGIDRVEFGRLIEIQRAHYEGGGAEPEPELELATDVEGKVILLMTGTPKDQATELSQRKCADILRGKGLVVEEIDGTLEENKAQRTKLFALSGKPAVYPQVFIKQAGAPGALTFVGDWEGFESLIECETLDEQMIASNPEILTFSKAFACLLNQ